MELKPLSTQACVGDYSHVSSLEQGLKKAFAQGMELEYLELYY